ncbi:hypothetical protein CcaverHIS002_0500070 [Cutaneotrichosporon cavernicola]|uniref:Major facilitator superfamily (MFS) profile domain-containing protein n=1 Tax=Cutaneotrichosporon cavernicola TaxID=279322 RepID=A0AA48L7U0_9TREE|nr:uncharacterized protein CcaverHIS019_0600070 [Cutaneotrichosporon cavernicola]BEI84606.1 hypothetical protein CcaverHIS002_0500070 [Cutaneotrichosporon cavernicola]BEI93548.1 hypothetical protein CcaverHIS019_0600070 [Cutaneotrichosporon cavernicola]BEJ01325.1 hypothetical protein CcaverHIS631_0600070 [Cutaneotrichosporon cavernicola]BEJ09092.1 hypothetical protein CcaverHIS641_0600070 [Cutaneotrichosporon cavernicola]
MTSTLPLEKEQKGLVEVVNTTKDESVHDLAYDNEDEEPVLHARTYFALLALFLLNFVQLVALTGPPSILEYIGKATDGTADQVWVPNVLSLMQAVGGPVISFASDTFQARKMILVGSCAIAFVGAAIAPGSKDIYRVVAAQVLIGFGFAAVPLAYAIPSEILPRRWRPAALAIMNVAAALGAVAGPLIAGAFTRMSIESGWRNFYWVQMGIWGATALGLVLGYRPPKRHTKYDHLSLFAKIGKLDLPGMLLLTSGLTLLLAGLTLGGNPWAWTNARVLSTLVIGIVVLIVFGIYEWRGTKTGILHHDLFITRTFPICIALIFMEGILLFSFVIFYPVLTSSLFETDPVLTALRTTAFWMASGLGTVVYGLWSTKRRTIRSPLLTGFAIMTAGIVGMTTIQPNHSTRAVVFNALAGLGFGSPLVLIIAGVQLSIPHHLIATATAVVTSSRAVAASSFTAIYAAAFGSGMTTKLPTYVSAAALAAGLPREYLGPFIGGLTGDMGSLSDVPGVTPDVINAGVAAIRQATADSMRVVYIIAASFGVLACITTLFVGDVSSVMNYRVDAPVEELHAKHRHDAA